MKKEEDNPEKQLASMVGALIAERRKAKKLTQAKLAEKMGVEKETVGRLEKGNISPTLTRLAQFAKFLDCEISDFFRTSPPELIDQALSLANRMESLSDSQRTILVQLFGKTATAMGKANQKDRVVIEKFLTEIL